MDKEIYKSINNMIILFPLQVRFEIQNNLDN